MDMEQTILATFPRKIYLGGPSANSDWNVPVQLKSLCGEIDAAQMLVQMHEPLLNRRLAGHGESLTELGVATMCIVATSMIVERSIKTLVAQTRPDAKPPPGTSIGNPLQRSSGPCISSTGVAPPRNVTCILG